MDVLEIDAASNTGVDNVRELIEELQYRPARDRNKIYIIDEVHMLSNAAFNALLKTLEEPPPHVKFILATTEYHKIPATILSRCQQYSFKLIRYPLILDRLHTIAQAEGIQISNIALEQIAYSSGGSMRDAMSAMDQVIAFSGQTVRDEDVVMLLGLVEPAILGNMVRAIATADTGAILNIVGDLAAAGQDLQNFCRCLLGRLRDLMVAKSGVSEAAVLGVPESMLPELATQAGLFSREDLLRLFDALLRVEADLKHATQTRFQLEMGLIELAQLPKLRPLEQVIADLTRLLEDGPATGGSSGGPPGQPHQTQAARSESLTRPESRSAGSQVNPPKSAAAQQAAAAAVPPGIAGTPGSAQLLDQIASALRKESLAPAIHQLAGAKIEGDSVIFDFGTQPNEFFRRQLKENLAAIEEAAGIVLGRKARVLLGDGAPEAAASRAGSIAAEPAPDEDILERAKKDPTIRSFLDAFPGPVKAEKIKP